MSEVNEEVVDTDVAVDTAPAEFAEGFTPEKAEDAGVSDVDAVTEGEVPAEGVAAATAFAPNFKFKAMGQEKEIDDWARPLIKDAASEQKVRELYEKAHGLEPVKQKLHRTREQLTEVNENFGKQSSFIEESVAYRNAGDFGKLFEYWKIDPVSVAKWLSREIEMNDPNTPPNVKEAYRQSLDATRRNITLERENRSLESSHGESAVNTLSAELHSVMSQPDVAQTQAAIDARTGKPGSFYNMVVKHAIVSETRDGRVLSADQAVKEVMEEMGVFMEPKAPGAASATSKTGLPSANPSQRPASLPKAQSTGSVPMKKTIKSTDDLRNLYKTRFGKAEA